MGTREVWFTGLARDGWGIEQLLGSLQSHSTQRRRLKGRMLIQTQKCSVLILEPSRVLFPTIDPLVTSILSSSPKVTDNEGAAAVLELLTSVPGAHVSLAGCVQKHAVWAQWLA